MKKRMVSALLSVAMLFSMLVLSAKADGFSGVAFVDELNYYMDVDGWNYDETSQILTLHDVSANGLIESLPANSPTLKIVLEGTNQLNFIDASCNLTFEGTGTLNLVGSDAIDTTLRCGSITVNSGTLNITTRVRDSKPGPMVYAIHCIDSTVHTGTGTYTTSGNFVMNGGAVNLSLPDPSNTYYSDLICNEKIINAGSFQSNSTKYRWQEYPGGFDFEDELDFLSMENDFADVLPGTYYYAPVNWALYADVTNGTSATTFSPEATCTRGQIITFLWRASGSPKPMGSGYVVDNVADTYYYEAVQWAKENGLFDGDYFTPDVPCTRAMAVEFMWKDAGRPNLVFTNYDDVPADASYATAVQWASAWEITKGTGEGTFSPDMTCTRGQIVTFLYRYLWGE